MRILGKPYREIAAELGISIPGAFKIVKRVLERTRQEANEVADDVRALELERLDKMLDVALRLIETNDDLHAIDRAVRIMERRARLIGLDMPEQHEFSGSIGLSVSALDEVLKVARAAKEK